MLNIAAPIINILQGDNVKKIIPLVFCLLMLCSCGKRDKISENDNPIGDTTTIHTESETKNTTENNVSAQTTIAKAEDVKVTLVSTGPPRSKKIYTGAVVTVFHGPNILVPDFGEDYNVYGTVSPVPVAEVPATTVEALIDPTLEPENPIIPIEPNTEPAAPDMPYSDQSSLTYEIFDNYISVLRDGKEIQTLSADTIAAKTLIIQGEYTQEELIIRTDFDFDGYADLFFTESVGPLYTVGRYFRYDASTGMYNEWQPLNNIGYLATVNTNGTLSVHMRDGAADYEDRTYSWYGQALMLVHMDKQYTTASGEIYLDHYDYSSGMGTLYSREQYVDGSYIEVSLT